MTSSRNPKLDPLPLFVLASSGDKQGRAIREAYNKGKLRLLAPRLYTSDLTTDAAQSIRHNWFTVLALMYPGSVISHRSGIEGRPSSEHSIYLTYKYTKNISLPGLMIHLLEGPGPQEADRPFGDTELYFASETRYILENLQPSRSSGSKSSKCVSIEELENLLELVLRVRGENGLNTLRDQAKELSKTLGWEKEFVKLNKITSALLSTASVDTLKSKQAQARALGEPYDPLRIELFEILFHKLRNSTWKEYYSNQVSSETHREIAFFEAYFSNFIEGTVFEIKEAKEIIEANRPMLHRHQDSHDIMATYNIANDKVELSNLPKNAEAFLIQLQRRHHNLMKERPDKRPGQWKMYGNMAGNTVFVDPQLVIGTLKQGYSFYKALESAQARAAMMMFIVSEVHPFDDGNGRLARLMMNAELATHSKPKIIITTKMRQDYLRALRKLSRQKDPLLYIRLLQKAYDYTAYLYSLGNFDAINEFLKADNSYDEIDESYL